jgi:hypothetical protein
MYTRLQVLTVKVFYQVHSKYQVPIASSGREYLYPDSNTLRISDRGPTDYRPRPDGFSNLADFRWFGEPFSIWSNLSFFFKSEGIPLCNQMYKNYDIKNVSWIVTCYWLSVRAAWRLLQAACMLLTLETLKTGAFRRSLSQWGNFGWLSVVPTLSACLEPRGDGFRASLGTVCPFLLVRRDDGDLPGTDASSRAQFCSDH